VAKVLTEQPPPLRPRRPLVPSAVEDAVLTALQKLPADRFGSAKEFADALGGTGGTHASTLALPSSLPRPPRLPRPVMLAASALLLTAAGLAGWLSHRQPAAPITRFQLLPPPGTRIAFPVSGVATYVAISADGRKAVYAGSTGDAGDWRLYVRDLD